MKILFCGSYILTSCSVHAFRTKPEVFYEWIRSLRFAVVTCLAAKSPSLVKCSTLWISVYSRTFSGTELTDSFVYDMQNGCTKPAEKQSGWTFDVSFVNYLPTPSCVMSCLPKLSANLTVLSVEEIITAKFKGKISLSINGHLGDCPARLVVAKNLFHSPRLSLSNFIFSSLIDIQSLI